MKTEIDRICGIMYTLLEHQPVIDVPYEKINDIAVALVKDGYGKISEYTAEIERLKAENDTNMQYIRMMGIQSHIKTSNERVKQAKIDILNEVKARCSETFVGKRIISAVDIDKIIEEVQNGKDIS